MEEKASFTSDGLKLQAVLHRPQGPGSRPAFMVLHGFGGNKDGGGTIASCRLLEKLGYAALRFDFRGCGESEGPRGRTICLEQVADVLFSEYLLPFELVSILLLVAVVGSVVMAKKRI